jgi:hypothetical protein
LHRFGFGAFGRTSRATALGALVASLLGWGGRGFRLRFGHFFSLRFDRIAAIAARRISSEPEDARTHTDQVRRRPLGFNQQAGLHHGLGVSSHHREQVVLDGQPGQLLDMEWLSLAAQNLNCCFYERHRKSS